MIEKRFPKSTTAFSVIVAACLMVLIVAAAATGLGRTGDGPRFLGLWEFRGFLLVATAAYAVTAWTAFALAPPVRRRRRIFGWIAATLTVGGILLILEGAAALRLVDYRTIFVNPFLKPWENPRNILDPELLYRHPPHERFVGEVPGDLVSWYGIDTDRRYRVDFRYDHRGFRNPQDRELADIVVIGDSKVEGSLVPVEHIATSRLEQRLNVPVLNLGQIGYGPQQCAIVLRRFGLAAMPHVVVWMLFEGNDLTLDYQRYRRSVADYAAFVRENHGLPARSFTRNLFLALARGTTPPSAEQRARGFQRSCTLTRGNEVGQRLYFAYPPMVITSETTAELRKPLEYVLQGQQACVAAGVHFLLVFVPIKYRVYRDLCAMEDGTEAAAWTLHDIPALARDWSEEHDIAFLDLTPELRERAAAGELVYHLDDGHWTAAGHEVAARRIAEVIESRGWMERPSWSVKHEDGG